MVENEPKTLSSCRTLPLDEGLVTVLKRASARYAEEKLALGEAYADSEYVAVNEAGGRTRLIRSRGCGTSWPSRRVCVRFVCTMRVIRVARRCICGVCRWR